MIFWDNLIWILHEKKIDVEEFLANYSSGQIRTLKKADHRNPNVKDISKFLDVDLDFITRYAGGREKFAAFPKTDDIQNREKNYYRYILDEHPFTEYYFENISVEAILSEVVKEASWKDFDNVIENFYSKDFSKKIRVKLNYSVLVSWDMSFNIRFTMFKDVKAEKKRRVDIHIEWIIVDIESGAIRENCNISIGDKEYGTLSFTNNRKDYNPLWQLEYFGKEDIKDMLKLIKTAAEEKRFSVFESHKKDKVLPTKRRQSRKADNLNRSSYTSILDAYNEYVRTVIDDYY